MIKDSRTLIEAKRLAVSDEPLLVSLKEWHAHKGNVAPGTEDYNFDDWLVVMLGEMSDRVGVDYPEFPTSEQLVHALRVNSIGDFVAVRASEIAKRDHLESDINCYVEDGIVYSSIWLKSGEASRTKAYADKLAEKLRRLGYSAEGCIDEEDSREVTVNAQLDFPLYVKLVERGMNPECLLCGCRLK